MNMHVCVRMCRPMYIGINVINVTMLFATMRVYTYVHGGGGGCTYTDDDGGIVLIPNVLCFF